MVASAREAFPESSDLPSGNHISDIPTHWSDIDNAHRQGPEARGAQDRIMRRYGPAIMRYLNVLTRDYETSNEILQRFACILVEGRMKQASPERGKFRNYLKTTLINLFRDLKRERARNKLHLTSNIPELFKDDTSPCKEADRKFVEIWRNELIKNTFDELMEQERRSGKPHYTVLDLRLRHPDVRTEKLSRLYTEQTGRLVRVDIMRKMVFLARECFADTLLRIVEETLHQPGLNDLEEELIELNLHEYCKKALKRRRTA